MSLNDLTPGVLWSRQGVSPTHVSTPFRFDDLEPEAQRAIRAAVAYGFSYAELAVLEGVSSAIMKAIVRRALTTIQGSAADEGVGGFTSAVTCRPNVIVD